VPEPVAKEILYRGQEDITAVIAKRLA
jgi:hypothetical protein